MIYQKIKQLPKLTEGSCDFRKTLPAKLKALQYDVTNEPIVNGDIIYKENNPGQLYTTVSKFNNEVWHLYQLPGVKENKLLQQCEHSFELILHKPIQEKTPTQKVGETRDKVAAFSQKVVGCRGVYAALCDFVVGIRGNAVGVRRTFVVLYELSKTFRNFPVTFLHKLVGSGMFHAGFRRLPVTSHRFIAGMCKLLMSFHVFYKSSDDISISLHALVRRFPGLIAALCD